MNTSNQEASFAVTDAKLFNIDQLKEAFAKVNFNDISAKKKPGD